MATKQRYNLYNRMDDYLTFKLTQQNVMCYQEMKTDDSDHGSSKENCLGRGVMLIAMYVSMYTDYIVLRLRCAAPALRLR